GHAPRGGNHIPSVAHHATRYQRRFVADRYLGRNTVCPWRTSALLRVVTVRKAKGSRCPTSAIGRMDTREKLIIVAEKLMLRDGYSATRVDDILLKAGLAKGSFYHFFDSKESLALAALEHYYADRVGRLAAGGYATETDPLRRA